MSTIGFVGLGAMGSRIAGRLLDAGYDLYGTDLTKSKGQPLIERGLQWRESPREVAAAANVVFSMVTDDAAVHAITSGPDGILAGLQDGKVYVDMSTVSPRISREVAGQVRGRRRDARRPGLRQYPPGRERNARDHGRRRRAGVRQG
jgi:3-hydroxyisobutyrate dehydrogenase-like beta-hydroxyacid dehydrogenase